MFTVDLHSHILPWMDDGADDLDVSLSLLHKEAADGVRQVVLSSHFHPLDENVAEFRIRRNSSFRQLKKAIENSDMAGKFDLRPAAEIRYNPSLLEIEDLGTLCIDGTKVLLIEFSTQHYPEFVQDVFYRLQTKGYIPVMAHVERFPWLRDNPEFLYNMVCGGAYAQVNADSIVKSKESLSFIRRMMDCGLIHCIGTDTHNMTKRPPHMKEAEKVLASNPGSDVVDYMDEIGRTLLAGRIPNAIIPSKPKKSFWDFFRK